MSTLFQSESFRQAMARIEQMYADLSCRMQDLQKTIEQTIAEHSAHIFEQSKLIQQPWVFAQQQADSMYFSRELMAQPHQAFYVPRSIYISREHLIEVVKDFSAHSNQFMFHTSCVIGGPTTETCKLNVFVKNDKWISVGEFAGQILGLISIVKANHFVIQWFQNRQTHTVVGHHLRPLLTGLLSHPRQSFNVRGPGDFLQQQMSRQYWTDPWNNNTGFRVTQTPDNQNKVQSESSKTDQQSNAPSLSLTEYCDSVLKHLEEFKDYQMQRVDIFIQQEYNTFNEPRCKTIHFRKVDETVPVNVLLDDLTTIKNMNCQIPYQFIWDRDDSAVFVDLETLKSNLLALIQIPEVKETPTSSPACLNVGDMLQHLSRFAKETGITMSKSTVELFYLHYDYQNNHFVIMRDDSATPISLNRLKKIFMKKIEQLDKEIRNYKIPMAATIRVSLGDDVTTGSVKSVKEMIDLITTYPKTV